MSAIDDIMKRAQMVAEEEAGKDRDQKNRPRWKKYIRIASGKLI